MLSIATNIASPPRSDSGDEVTLNGAEALKFLVGKTLRSVEKGRSAPDRRYFLTETIEYYCRGWNPSEVPPKDRARIAEAAGCDLLLVSIKEGRLCESYQYDRCADRSFSLIFTPRSNSGPAKDGQILGRAKLDLSPFDSRKNEFDLVQGNDTIFPTFDPTSQRKLLQPDVAQHGAETHYCGTMLTGAEAIARLIGNTVVHLDSKGKADGRSGEFFSQDGRVIVITIPTHIEGADLQHPSAEAAGTIFINRWRIKIQNCAGRRMTTRQNICAYPQYVSSALRPPTVRARSGTP